MSGWLISRCKQEKLKANVSLKNENNKVKQNRNYDTLHTRSHVRISLSTIMQLRKPDSLQLKMMLLLHWKAQQCSSPSFQECFITKILTSLWEAAWRVFFHPPISPCPWFFLSPSTPQGHRWPLCCDPAYSLLWFCFTYGSSRLFKLTKTQGTLGLLRLCCTCTNFPCCAQEGTHSFFNGAHSSVKRSSPSSPRTRICATATSSPVALQKIILTHLVFFKSCHEDPFHTSLLWPHPTSMFFFHG